MVANRSINLQVYEVQLKRKEQIQFKTYKSMCMYIHSFIQLEIVYEGPVEK